MNSRTRVRLDTYLLTWLNADFYHIVNFLVYAHVDLIMYGVCIPSRYVYKRVPPHPEFPPSRFSTPLPSRFSLRLCLSMKYRGEFGIQIYLEYILSYVWVQIYLCIFHVFTHWPNTCCLDKVFLYLNWVVEQILRNKMIQRYLTLGFSFRDLCV